MSLFQKSVLKNKLEQIPDSEIDSGWNYYKSYFLNKEKQEEIKSNKEEEYQMLFFLNLFYKCLGYNVEEPNKNLWVEVKNVTDSKKADGAIKKEGEVIAVIELKSTKTKNFKNIQDQAFGYKVNQPKCEYIITSNFEKLRFYINDTTQFEEFDLFNLNKEQYKLLHLCLSKENIFLGIPKKIKEESLIQEENITKKLYKDYSNFRNELFNSLVESNSEFDKLLLFNKTQKLLDRFLFIFFAEDRRLLPPNTIIEIISNWENDTARGRPVLLYSNFKEYFNLINVGRPKKGDYEAIYAYNGGLFAKDEVLDKIQIDDDILFRHTQNLSHYDFESEISVNILGHIFEHSLSEIEEIQNEIAGIETGTSKRKKDGVFYTPQYIIKYIVDNTLGKLCEEKKDEFGINEDKYENVKRRTKSKLSKLNKYREWLLSLKICDPACGSGAFLNQTLNFLIEEHNYVDELTASYHRASLILSDITSDILENNLYGVDINEESVEIAKLSLWLRTAQEGRKLTSLNSNLRCGNSLIDDPEVAGDKAFNWQNEFSEVFAKGGFDVIIGNPPYVRKQGIIEHYPEMCAFYEEKYQSATANYDIYALFMERSFDLINIKGMVSFILPHKFLVTDFGIGIRQFFKENQAVKSILHFGSEMVFADASTYTCIINLNKKDKNKLYFKKIKPLEINDVFDWDYMLYENLNKSNWDLHSQKVFNLIKKLKRQPYTVDDIFEKIFTGLQTSGDDFYFIYGNDENDYVKGKSKLSKELIEIEMGLVKPILKGEDIGRYRNLRNKIFVIFPYKFEDGKAILYSENEIKELFPLGYKYLKKNEAFLRNRENGKMDIESWFAYIYPKSLTEFEQPKIITSYLGNYSNMSMEYGNLYHNTKGFGMILKNQQELSVYKFYLGILNSRLFWFFIKNTSSEYRGGYYVFTKNYISPFPLPKIPENPNLLIEKVNSILSLNKDLQKDSSKFLRTLQRELELDKLSKKLENWYTLDYAEFLKELKKKKIKLSLKQSSGEWEDYFLENQVKAVSIKNKINKTDKEIDQMVYELYGLTKEEIEIVESS